MSVFRNHWLLEARHLPSPNFNERPDGMSPSLVVLHNISLPPGKFGGGHVDELFCNRLDPAQHEYFATISELQVSSHFLIERCGRITQYVALDKRAWHAGRSCWQGRENCNDFSIGIELEGADEVPYDERQYACLARLIPLLWQDFPDLPRAAVTGHEFIAPGRKTDPGPAFDWPRLERLLGQPLAARETMERTKKREETA